LALISSMAMVSPRVMASPDLADWPDRLATRPILMVSWAATVVYQTGTLYGEWPDGTPFEGNRYVDRYVVRHGKIARMEVWNDSAEHLLVRAGMAKP
jgi:hypothetical protein